MRVNGKVLVSKAEVIEGSHKAHAWSDTYLVRVPVQFDVEPTDGLVSKAVEAFRNSKWLRERHSSWGALRWLQGRLLKEVKVYREADGRITDVELIVEESWGIAD